MAPKKNTATPVAASASAAEAVDASAASPAVAKKAAAPRAKKPAAPKPAKPTPVDGEPVKRNMSAVSNEFVSTVHKSLSEDLAAKLRVKDIKEICEAFVKTLVGNVMDGKNVNFTNNMSFARRVRAARVYKNLKTQESITKPKHYVMTMTVKPSLKKQFDGVEVAADA